MDEEPRGTEEETDSSRKLKVRKENKRKEKRKKKKRNKKHVSHENQSINNQSDVETGSSAVQCNVYLVQCPEHRVGHVILHHNG